MIPEGTRGQGFKGLSERKKDIAEGYGRKTTRDYIRMLYMAESERMLKPLIKSLENKPLNP